MNLLNSATGRPSAPTAGRRRFSALRLPLSAMMLLAMTAGIGLLKGHYYLTRWDDLLELWCDQVASLSQLLHVERVAPLAADTFLYHALIHFGVRLFGVNSPVLLLPALFGFLLMQACVFCFVRRIASTRSATFALALPALSGVMDFTNSVRSYGLLLGLFGMAIVSWQTATHRKANRRWALAVLALSIALAINTHFYGIFVLLPLGAAELSRTYQNRRVDVPVVLSMTLGTAGILLIVPFVNAAAVFREYYPARPIGYSTVLQAYNFVLTGHAQLNSGANHAIGICFGVCSILILWSCVRGIRNGTLRVPAADFIVLLVLAGLPIVEFLLGRFVTHAMESRYALASVIAISALAALALDPLLRRRTGGAVLLALLFCAIVAKGFLDVRAQRQQNMAEKSSMVMAPEVRAAILASPSKLLYTQDIQVFGFLVFHDPDAATTAHLALVYSKEREMHFNGSAVSALVSSNLGTFAPYTILPFENIETEPGDHIFVVSEGGWNWVGREFAENHMTVKPIGKLLGSDVVSARFPAQRVVAASSNMP